MRLGPLLAAFVAGALALPPAAGAGTLAAGTVTGQMAFDGAGVPGLLAPCAPTSYTFEGTVSAFAVTTEVDGAAGNNKITASGGGGCEGALSGGGVIGMTIHESRATASGGLSCDALTGGYSRVLTDFSAVAGGTCRINGGDPSAVNVIVKGELVGTEFVGAAVVVPA